MFVSAHVKSLVPDGRPFEAVAAEVTHLAIGAHPDDIEFMAYHGIEACYNNPDGKFAGVVCTDGAGSPRSGPYAAYSNEAMMAERWKEQAAASTVGRYAFALQLGYPSAEIKAPDRSEPDADLRAILEATRPRVLYTHNPADKHATHVAVCLRVVRALRALPAERRPAAVWGCEVWRDLDWMPDRRKNLLDAGQRPHLAAALNGCFDSQISGGKRYDLAVTGRRIAQATFFESHEVDSASHVTLAMDLMPLVNDPALTMDAYVAALVREFHDEVRAGLAGWEI